MIFRDYLVVDVISNDFFLKALDEMIPLSW